MSDQIGRYFNKKIQNLAVKILKILGNSGFARIVMIIRDDEIFVLESNSITSLTPTPLVPRELKATGVSFSKFLDQQIEIAENKASW